MSAGELEVTLEMCGQPRDGDLSMLPQWFQDCAAKGTSEQYQLTIIRKWMMNNCYYDDADIPMTATLLKMIRKRAWCGTDGNISRPSLVNAMEGLSPFAMQDMDENAVAHFNDENALLDSASLVSVADIRALRKKVKLSVPTEAEEFMLILKRFANLLYALFSARCPLFRCTQEVIIAIKAFSREARRTMSQATKASILWIGLLQARQFALGEMQILFEYTQMHQDLRAKNHASTMVKCRQSWLTQQQISGRRKMMRGVVIPNVLSLPQILTHGILNFEKRWFSLCELLEILPSQRLCSFANATHIRCCRRQTIFVCQICSLVAATMQLNVKRSTTSLQMTKQQRL
jgi:hypothetical protein